MTKRSRKPIALLISAALAASLCALPSAAFAAGGLSGSVGDTTSWKVPSSSMQNIGIKGSGTDQVPHKIITTWANAWALSGPDYLGVSNSGPLNQQGGGSASANLANAQNDTLLGIWASSANEVPNAYNWNFFYNLKRVADGQELVDWSAIDVQNGSAPGFDSESGVWAPFKYRPEIIWYSNSLKSKATADAVSYINQGKYFTNGTDVGFVSGNGQDRNIGDTSELETGDVSEYAIDGDATYSPKIVDPNSGSPLTFLGSFYELATQAEAVISETANNISTNGIAVATEGNTTSATYNGAELWNIKSATDARSGNTTYTVNTDGINWKNANLLPRATRYEFSSENPMTARECALAIEKFTRGSVYYVLSQIDDGKVAKKKVALLTTDPSNGSATVVEYKFVDGIGGGPTGGKTGIASLAIDQLTGTDPQVTDSYTTYTVSADDLANCDYVVDANGSMTANQLQSWVAKNVSNYSLKQRALNDVQYLTNSPAIMNGHNYTAEKLLWGGFNLDFFYPELFPNMELTNWWYDNIYHLNANNIKQAMQWGLANASLPAETNLASLGKGYSEADLDAKFKDGYDYFMGLADRSMYTVTTETTSAGTTTATVNSLEPSEDFTKWAQSQTSFGDTIAVSGTKSYSKKVGDKTFKLDAVANISNAKLAYTSSNTKVATVANDGTITIKGAGKANITVTASKARYNDGSLTVVVNVAKAAQPMTVKAKSPAVKVGKTAAASKVLTVSKNQGAVTYKKASGNAKILVAGNGKVTVKKGLKAGTYTVKIKVTAKGNANYDSGSKTVSVKVKVKK